MKSHLKCKICLALGALLIASGCASTARTQNPFDGSTASSNRAEVPIQVDVRNLNFNDATVWAVKQGQRVRLGRVTGKTNMVFNIDWNLAIPISFRIDIVGGRECNTLRIPVDRDARVWVQIPAYMGNEPCRVGRQR